MKGRVFI